VDGGGGGVKAGWQRKAIGEVCDVVNGGTPKTGVAEYWDGPHQWITPAEMGKRVKPYIGQTERTITDSGMQNSSARLLPQQSVILSSRAPIGHLVINTAPMATNQGCKGLVPRNGLDSKYLYYYLAGIVPLLNDLGSGATFKELSGGKLKEVPVPIAPLPEQHRIVAILDEAFNSIATAKANAEKNLQNARALFESHLQSVFTEGDDGVEETTLGETYDVRDGTHDSPKFYDEGFPLVTSKNLKRDGLNFDSIKFISEVDYRKINERSGVNVGDVLFAMIGTIGNPVVVQGEPSFAIKNMALFKVPKSQSSEFLRYFLSAEVTLSRMKREANGTTQKFVGLGYLRKFPIRLPSLPIQREIVRELDQLSAETDRLESIYQQKLTALDGLKKSLLHQAFSGQL
jgi:type I restriction enzyme S subunit